MQLMLGTDVEILGVHKTRGTILNPRRVIGIVDNDPHNEEGNATAIGCDGFRETSSIEFRPGVSTSPVTLVNRLGALCKQLHDYFHPEWMYYRAGAYYGGEPLGGHLHVGWPAKYRFTILPAKITQLITALSKFTDSVSPGLFSMSELDERMQHARRNHRDYALPASYRPGSVPETLNEMHLEYRYPACWMNTPEEAFVFLGALYYLANTIFNNRIATPKMLDSLVEELLVSSDLMIDGINFQSNLETAVRMATERKTRLEGTHDCIHAWIAGA